MPGYLPPQWSPCQVPCAPLTSADSRPQLRWKQTRCIPPVGEAVCMKGYTDSQSSLSHCLGSLQNDELVNIYFTKESRNIFSLLFLPLLSFSSEALWSNSSKACCSLRLLGQVTRDQMVSREGRTHGRRQMASIHLH